jgi:iron-sulfur cluster assembly protein
MEIFTVTEKAKSKILDLMSREDIDPSAYFLKASVKGGGCSGLSYDLSFDDEISEEDKITESRGIKIAVDKRSFLYLFGTELDFSDGLNGKGFHFNNPNASRTCGCGESFGI